MSTAQGHIGIVGAGIAGIATAVRLAVQGWQVEVFEANEYPGGKVTEIREKGFRFDAGPSVFTLPKLVDELFELAGKNPREHFPYQKLENTCRYFYPDGTRINAWSDPQKFAEELQQVTGEPEQNVSLFLDKSRELYDITKDVFLTKSLHKAGTYLNSTTFKAFLKIGKLDAFRTMHEANSSRFQDPKVVQLFDRFATYNGSNPYRSPATLNIIPHLEHNIGAYFPKQGIHAITRSLVALAESLGVTFHLNARVEEILLTQKKVTGLRVNGKDHSFDRVVSNMDMVNTYRKLLPAHKAPEKLLKQEKSTSALIFYWGIGQSFPELDLHNIFFSDDYQSEFEAMQAHQVPEDPTIYLYISSKMVKGDAPEGKENWFVMINVPNNQGQDWDKLIQVARAIILKHISSRLGVEIEPLIETEAMLDPRSIEAKTSSFRGALYGNASNNRFAAFLRHANFSRGLKGLYFCGGSVHPGGGIPLCLLSAKIVSDLIGEAA